MAFLFIINDKIVYPNTETLMISPFKEIWERDTSKGKENALEEFAFIEFISSMRKSNPYRQYPQDKKYNVVKEAVITQMDWEADDLIRQAIEVIDKFQREASTTYLYYIAAKTAAEKMQNFFNTVNINATNSRSGNPLYKPRDITSALNDTEKVLSNLKTLEKKVEEELFEQTKNRSDKEVSPFANPDSLRKR